MSKKKKFEGWYENKLDGYFSDGMDGFITGTDWVGSAIEYGIRRGQSHKGTDEYEPLTNGLKRYKRYTERTKGSPRMKRKVAYGAGMAFGGVIGTPIYVGHWAAAGIRALKRKVQRKEI